MRIEETCQMRTVQEKFGLYGEIIYYKAKAQELCQLDWPTSHDFFALVFFERGNGIHIIEAKEYPIQNYQVHLIFPDQKHYWQFDQTTLVHQIFISRHTFETLIAFIKYPLLIYKKTPVLDLSPFLFYKIIQDCMDIGYFVCHPCEIHNYVIFSKTKIIIQYLTREIDQNFSEAELYKKHPILFSFHILLKNNVKRERAVHFYASRIGITANYLNVLCKKKFNQTATSYIRNYLKNEIEEDLIHSDFTLPDLADEYSFESLKTFKHFLKKNELD